METNEQKSEWTKTRIGNPVILRVPYPLGFYTKWVDGRTIPMPAGKDADADSGRASALAHPFIWKRERHDEQSDEVSFFIVRVSTG
jgi:hypothetical protein